MVLLNKILTLKKYKFAFLVNTYYKSLEVHFVYFVVYFYILHMFPTILLISSVSVIISLLLLLLLF